MDKVGASVFPSREMHKPGLGARKCGHCGARIEGPQSHLLRECPQCRSPLYGRFVPAPASPATGGHRAAPANRSGGGAGALVAIVGVLGLGAIAAVGAVGYVLSTKKAAATPASAPPSSAPSSGVPLLAETAATPSASASASNAAARRAKTPEHGTVSGTTTTTTRDPFGTTPLPTNGFTKPVPSTALGLTGNTQRCTATMTVTSFRPSSPTCSFNEKVRQGPGRLDFPCDGGSANATFGSQVFSGNVSTTTLSLTQSEPFNFNGCSVISTQRIVGARNSNQAAYTYSERIVGGSCSGVFTCRATATVEIR